MICEQMGFRNTLEFLLIYISHNRIVAKTLSKWILMICRNLSIHLKFHRFQVSRTVIVVVYLLHTNSDEEKKIVCILSRLTSNQGITWFRIRSEMKQKIKL